MEACQVVKNESGDEVLIPLDSKVNGNHKKIYASLNRNINLKKFYLELFKRSYCLPRFCKLKFAVLGLILLKPCNSIQGWAIISHEGPDLQKLLKPRAAR